MRSATVSATTTATAARRGVKGGLQKRFQRPAASPVPLQLLDLNHHQHNHHVNLQNHHRRKQETEQLNFWLGCRSSSRRRLTTLSTSVPDKEANKDAVLFPKNKQEDDYSTNDGLVEGVWMFCRHGDRTPARALCPPHRRDEEAAFWTSKLPSPDTASVFTALSRPFPVQILTTTTHTTATTNAMAATSTGTTPVLSMNHGRFVDVIRNPFGFLTQTGLDQLRETGHRFFHRYNHHGHHFSDRLDFRWEVAQDFLSVWNVQVYSTNYLRTILSVQSFLDGLLGTRCYPAPGEETIRRSYDPAVTKESRIPDHSWVHRMAQEHATASSSPLVKVCVRHVSNDPLNAFDRNPDLIADLVSEVMCSEAFQVRDAAAAPLAARLANVLPGLVKTRNSNKPITPVDFSQRSPSGINWVEAADHFVCRKAHDLEYSRFSDFEHDEKCEQTLTAMSHPTLMHLAWRFRQWYQNKPLLAAIAAPPLREIAQQIKETPQLGAHEKRPFYVYSCHDITILGLLYGIGADFLADDQTSSAWRWWPGYGSQLVFELVRIPSPAAPTDSNTNSSSSSTYVIRVLLDGKPVLSVEHDSISSNGNHGGIIGRPIIPTIGTGPKHLLTVDDFLRVVSDLEDAGGHDYDRLLGRK